MANTVIALKKSATPSAAPVSLANGELAINYADGKLFYKHANGTIAAISSGAGGDSFGTVNAAGTLIIADTAGDILTLEAGSGITITGDAINDKITISAIDNISPAFNQANTARDHANAAFLEANSSETIAISAFNKANLANVLAFNTGIGANAFTSATIAGANTAVGAGANAYANLVWSRSNTYADTVGTGANAFTSATIAGANTAVGTGANAYANLVWSRSNTRSDAIGVSANAFTSATIAGANTAVGLGANTYANATFVRLTAASQTITGNVNIVGDLTLSGNTFTIDATRLEVDDPLIYLAANNYSSDIVDIGFIANYVNATGSNVHTGLYREHTDKMYYLFQGYDVEPINNHIGAFSNNMTLAVLNADIRTSNLVLGGANAILTIAGVGTAANNFATATIAGANTAVGVGANAFTSATISGANTAVGAGANSYANLVWSRSNTRSDAIGVSANAFASATIAGANTAVGAGANTVGVAAFVRANNSLLSSSYTASDVLSKLLTVDGASSGLDADLLDGQHGSFYSTDTKATAAFGQANTALTTGQAAFSTANAALANTSGVSFNGNLNFPTGNVGIGTTSPLLKLDVSGSSTQGIRVISTDTSGSNIAYFTAQHGSGSSLQLRSGVGYTYLLSTSAVPLYMGTNAAIHMTVDASGNVLVGRTTSTVGQGIKLDVNGGINASAVLVNGSPIESGISTGKAIAMAIVFG